NIFYFVHLAYYSYVWHDECFVLLHLSGYTPEQLINYLFDGQIKSTEQLWQKSYSLSTLALLWGKPSSEC
ncbi:MAG: hypothetical protein ACKO1G_16755, partial [Microcystis aeruginosa]